jgi:hypothetical protein
MATKEMDLDVEFIGGQEALTAAEEKAFTEFLKRYKISTKKTSSPNGVKHSKRTKSTA